MVGAVAAWRASIHASTAAELNQQEIQERAQKAELDMTFRAIANEDSRLVPVYQSELANSIALSNKADQIRSSDPDLAASLDAQALEQLREAETTHRFMQGFVDEVPGASMADIQAQTEATIAYFRQTSDEYTRLQPDATHNIADDEHRTAQGLVEIVGVLILALVFLTLAHLAETSRRKLFRTAGLAIAVLGVLAAILIDPPSVQFIAVIGLAFVVANIVVIRGPEKS